MGEFDIRAPRGAVKKKKMLGRGTGTGYGSTAGRGTKGQNSRSGGGVRPGFEGGQMPLFRRIARRGFSNYPFKKTYDIVSLDKLEKFNAGETVNIDTLLDKGIIRSKKRAFKILANGTLTKKLTVENIRVSEKARGIIESLGGEVKNLDEEAKKKGKALSKQKKAVKSSEQTSLKAEEKSAKAKVGKAEKKPVEKSAKAKVGKAAQPKKEKSAEKKAPAKAQKEGASEKTVKPRGVNIAKKSSTVKPSTKQTEKEPEKEAKAKAENSPKTAKKETEQKGESDGK